MKRLCIAAVTLLAGLALAGPMAAQEAPAPSPVPSLPKAPIPYNQLRPKAPPQPPKPAVKSETEPEPPAVPLKRASANAACTLAYRSYCSSSSSCCISPTTRWSRPRTCCSPFRSR